MKGIKTLLIIFRKTIIIIKKKIFLKAFILILKKGNQIKLMKVNCSLLNIDEFEYLNGIVKKRKFIN
jgi:hypothetical protein